MSETIGGRIRVIRQERGLTLQELADAVGVQVGSVYRYESQGMIPSLQSAMALSDALGVSLEWLTKGDASDAA